MLRRVSVAGRRVIRFTALILAILLGLALPARLVQTLLGAVILGIVVVLWVAKRSEYSSVTQPDSISTALRIHGIFRDTARAQDVEWTVHRTPLTLLAFAVIGLLAGMFGLGAGWANVPALNLLMGAPLKIAVGTSSLILSMTPSAAWVYINQGAMLPIVVVPSIIGMMLGAMIGVRLLRVIKASAVRQLVIVMLLVAGLRALAKGIGG